MLLSLNWNKILETNKAIPTRLKIRSTIRLLVGIKIMTKPNTPVMMLLLESRFHPEGILKSVGYTMLNQTALKKTTTPIKDNTSYTKTKIKIKK